MSKSIGQVWKRALKGLECVFKRLVISLLKLTFTTRAGDNSARPIQRVLFLRFDKLGDMISALPVFETLAHERPEIVIEVLASRGNRIIIANDTRIARRWTYSKRPWQDIRTLWELRKRNFDVIIDMICLDSVTSLFISQFTGRHVRRIGIGKKRFRKYYTDHVALNPERHEHIVDSTLRTLTFIGIDTSRFICQAPPQLPGQTVARAEAFVTSLKDSQESAVTGIVGVNISAGQPNRIWQDRKVVNLINKLNDLSAQSGILILCAPEDRQRAELIRRSATGVSHLLPEGLNILDVSAIIAQLETLISPDTSLIHIARQYNVPVVGIYPTHGRTAAQWKPYGQTDGQVQGGSECNIHDITVAQVYEEFLRVSARTRQMTT